MYVNHSLIFFITIDNIKDSDYNNIFGTNDFNSLSSKSDY